MKSLSCLVMLSLLTCQLSFADDVGESAQPLSARDVLQLAQQTIQSRSNIRFFYHSTYNELVDTSEHMNAEQLDSAVVWKGDYLSSNGRVLSHHYPTWIDRKDRQISTNDRLNIVNEEGHQKLSVIRTPEEESTSAVIDSDYDGEVYLSGAWLLTSEIEPLSGQPPHLPRASLPDLLLGLAADKISIEQDESVPNGLTYKVAGHLPWGSCVLWIDPARGYNICKLIITWEEHYDEKTNFQRKWETRGLNLEQIDGVWQPTGCTLVENVEGVAYGEKRKWSSEALISLRDIKILDKPADENLFEMEWPEGFEIDDRR